MPTIPKTADDLAARYNLTGAEAEWVVRAVERGAHTHKAVVQIRADRVGPAAMPEYRPLTPDAATELGVTGDDDEPDDVDTDVEVLG